MNNDPITLGKVKKGKTGKPILVLFIFVITGSIVLFLPNILAYFGDYSIIDLIKNGQIIDFFQNHDKYFEESSSNTTPEVNLSENILINSKSNIVYNNVTLSNFDLRSNKITYTITVPTETNLDELNYYLVLNKDSIEIATIKLEGNIKDTKEVSFKFIKELDSTLGINGTLKEIKESDYPQVTLSSDEFGIASLLCKYENEEYDYTFSSNKLTSIRETVNVTDAKDTDSYRDKYNNYNTLKENILSLNGSASIVENNTGFVFLSIVNLNNTDVSSLNLSNYYPLNTNPSKISFEMRSKGYDCK